MSRNLLGNTVYLTKAEYDTLYSTGTVTLASGEVVTYSENDTYYVPESVASTTEDGLMSSSDKSKLDHISAYATQTQASSTNGNIIIDGVETTVYDDSDLRELASGKTGSYIIGTNASDDPGVFLSAGTKKLYKADGTEITSVSDFSTYVNGLTYLNTSTSHFKANTDSFSASGSTASSYLVFKPTQLIDGYTVVKNTEFASYFRPGDVFLVDITNVPDRWFDGVSAFYKLETTKIDMSHVVYDNTVGNTISVKKTFSVFPEMSTETSPTNSKQLITKYYTDNTFLKLSGGTMTGALHMSSQKLHIGNTSGTEWNISADGTNNAYLKFKYGSSDLIGYLTSTESRVNSPFTIANNTTSEAFRIFNMNASIADNDPMIELGNDNRETSYSIGMFYPDEIGQRTYLLGRSGNYDEGWTTEAVIPEMVLRTTPLTLSDNATLNTYTFYIAPSNCKLNDSNWNLPETNYTSLYYAFPGMDNEEYEMDFNDSRTEIPSVSQSTDIESVFDVLDPLQIIENVDGDNLRWYDSPSTATNFDERFLAMRNLSFEFRDLGRHSAQEITIHYSNGFNIHNINGNIPSGYDACTGTFNVYDENGNLLSSQQSPNIPAIVSGTNPEDVPIYSTTFTKGENDERIAKVEFIGTTQVRTKLSSFDVDIPATISQNGYNYLVFDFYSAEGIQTYGGINNLPIGQYLDMEIWFERNNTGDDIKYYYYDNLYIESNDVGGRLIRGYHNQYTDDGNGSYISGRSETYLFNTDSNGYISDMGGLPSKRVYVTATSGSYNAQNEAAALIFLFTNAKFVGYTNQYGGTIISPDESTTFNCVSNNSGLATWNGVTYRAYSANPNNYFKLYVPDGTLTINAGYSGLRLANLDTTSNGYLAEINNSHTITSVNYQMKDARLNVYGFDFVFDNIIYSYKPLANKEKIEKLIYDKHTELTQNIDSVSSKLLDIEYKTAGNNQDIAVLESNQQELKVMAFLDTLPTAKPKWADTLAYYNGILYHCIPDPDVFGTGKVSGRSTYYIYDEHEGNTPSTSKINNIFGAEIVTNKTNIYEGRHSLLMGNSRSSGGNLELKENFTSEDSTFYIKCMKINVEPYVFKNTQNSSIIIRPCTINITENDETGTYSNSWSFEIDRPTTIEITPSAMQDYQLVISGSRTIADPENDGATIDSGDARFYIKGVTTIASDEEGQVENEYVWKELGGSGSGSGTSDYNLLTNKPQINGTTLNTGNTSLSTLGIQSEINDNNKLPYSYLSGTPTIPATNVIPAQTAANRILLSTSTSGTATWSGSSIGSAAYKSTTTSVTSGSTDLVTSGGVYTAINTAITNLLNTAL